MARIPVDQPYTITTQFGVPDSNARFGRHSGIDYAVPLGRAVYAPASGQLTNVDSATGGNMVVIFDGRYYHRLMHNSAFSRSNGPVNQGEQVARAGTTGLSTGVHCHWDVNNQGAYPTSFSAFINPESIIGGDMADKIDVNVSRVLSHGVLARNGLRGRPYSLDGSAGDPWVGGELTNSFIMDIFNSAEARAWRDSQTPSSVQGINAQLDSIPVLKQRIAELEAQLAAGGGGYVPAPALFVKK